ncbi:trehalose-6-phosphate synthase [Streptomyces litmocidini]|uniref:trehalose-6-phosphate synthase n=1 Tax=Streptomyces litmocidini TaxID=67318 RepID=UPI0036FFEA44
MTSRFFVCWWYSRCIRTDLAGGHSLGIDHQAVAAANDLGRAPSWRPVEYVPHTLDFAETVDHHLAADVFQVASLADGMNLAAQEYVTARPGVLVLSRHAGIAQNLAGAGLLTGPHQPDDLVRTLHAALTMTTVRCRRHLAGVSAEMRFPAPAAWARNVIAAIRAASPVHGGLPEPKR